MARRRRRTPPRNSKGRFMKRARRRGRNPATAGTATVKSKTTNPRRRRRRRNNPVASVVPARAANPRKRRRARRRSNPVASAVVKVVAPRAANPRRRRPLRRPKKSGRRVGARRRNRNYHRVSGYGRKKTVRPHLRRTNPLGMGGLMSNQGPFTRAALASYGTAVVGLGLGIGIADFVDRHVATMAPADGNNPWYGRNAAAAIQRRPDAMRLGVQAGGAVAGMVLTYATRRMRVLPWLLGGTALGFGTNLFGMLVRWWGMPMILREDDTSAISPGNRYYSLEQAVVQDQVDALFENYRATPGLASGQAGEPVSIGPLATQGGPTVYALGARRPRFVRTGKLGMCAACGGEGGHWDNCRDYCSECPGDMPGNGYGHLPTPPAPGTAIPADGVSPGVVYGTPREAAIYTVREGDNMVQFAQLAGVHPSVIGALPHNGGRPLESFKPGERVYVEETLGHFLHDLEKRREQNSQTAGVPAHSNGNGAAPVADFMPPPQPVPDGSQADAAMWLMPNE